MPRPLNAAKLYDFDFLAHPKLVAPMERGKTTDDFVEVIFLSKNQHSKMLAAH